MKKILLSAFIALALVGCASSGNRVLKNETHQTVAAKIINGSTSKEDVRKMFGDPQTTSFTDSGSEIWKYEFSNVTADAINYVPIVNWFGSSASGTKKELSVLFDKNDIVVRHSMINSDVKQKTGLFNAL
ncbi:hypothetical protein [Vogesella indigofera]|uniref:hypothetical protein n=1 Tax=Vogesella indigofera TaxID=45465 RepID=UPI00234F04D3|nr:hypothetical protein [Vogesella indigofera]MDC7712321.1 hypothetical protein [Vogesella indigofera]